MRAAPLVLSCTLVMLLLPLADSFSEDSLDPAKPTFESQFENDDKILRGLQSQPKTLEVEPQPSADTPPATIDEIPTARQFRQHDELAALDRNFRPQPDGDHHPYLGASLEYSTQCYLGMEEHGFEVMSVYPGSPADKAGLRGKQPPSAIGVVGGLAGSALGPLALVALPLLKRSGALGSDGDLIVAVDDKRVRNQKELTDSLGHLRPGDTTYVTVIRPLPGGAHRTMRIAMHLDRETIANGPAPATAAAPATKSMPARASSPGAESAAN
ncbi:MAG: PDZ domain-containing protein [Candidatus Binatus sp.]|uniref:PDZ domain-containing protein n=1 Tax=Candidatus Binatus sp. TaxID=2811406 RepID=UPI0027280910|nr:PDZ domain-containing protein [Candidatus Binatus sp.]MDO8433528.1 PDZ domain-containing protein [Candidatus Binatus sp.]